MAVSLLVSAAVTVTSCSSNDDDDDLLLPPTFKLLDFEGTRIALAGPDSYGANLYAIYTGDDKFIEGEIGVEEGVTLKFGLNNSTYYNAPDFSAGGMVLSQWNYRTNKPGQTDENWWKSYENQCSVYNFNSQNGLNQGAGAGGSNTFAVINGYDSPYGEGARFEFTAGASYEIVSMMICPTSYVYGIITEGNPMDSNNPDKSLKEQKGWFKILAYGFDAEGNPTNDGNPVEKYICDYRDGAETEIPISNVWSEWSLSKLGKVNSVKFDFDGSSRNEYGLLTPAYMCIDNILLRLRD